jgi:membrane-associated protein
MPEHLVNLSASPWVLVVVFAVAGLDAVLPFAPSESTVIAVGVGAAASGQPRLFLLIAVAATGAYLGDRLSYHVGRRATATVTSRLGRLRRGQALHDWARRLMYRRGGLLIVFARYVPGGRSAVALTAGVVGYPVVRFRWYTVLGVLLWAGGAATLGYVGGAMFAANPLLGLAAAWAVAALIMIVATLVRWVVSRWAVAR